MSNVDNIMAIAEQIYIEDREKLNKYFTQKEQAEETKKVLFTKYSCNDSLHVNCSKWTKKDQKELLKAIKILTVGFWGNWKIQKNWLIERYSMSI